MSTWYVLNVDTEIDLFAAYIEDMEEFLISKEKHYRNSIEKMDDNERFTFDENGETVDGAEGYLYELYLVENFKNILRRSTVVDLFSFLEGTLIDRCEKRKSPEIDIRVKDLGGGDDLEKIRKYFSKVLHTPLPTDTTEWQEIQNYRFIRNCITHNKGIVDDGFAKRDEIIRYVTNHPKLLGKDSNNELIIKPGFSQEVLNTIKSFLMKVP
jgi:hypothetical protein